MYAIYIGILFDGAKDDPADYYDRPFDAFKKYYELTSLYRTPDEWYPLLDVVKAVPEWNNAAWLLRYQITALLETFKRLL